MDRLAREEFEVNDDGVTVDGYHTLVPVSLKAMYVGQTLIMVICVLILAFLSFKLPEYLPGHEIFTCYIPMMLIALVIIYCMVSPTVYHRRYRYRIDEDKIEIRRGVLTIDYILVPVERIHQVEISRGPIDRAFGLADITVTTAGGSVSIPYLEDEVAQSIAVSLNERIVAMLKARDQ